ncbi:DUF2188 domain-containing protein [Leptospira montravelensis]|uniref:DUF2188 domain-containing protein n=1 Tax=Leptospira montravelensis TaxID=2484961 RepID=A0ABY2LQK9_9LEPT|nr:DUF2188 domain-containing protein [Leptospira montravelensis]TGK78658.1 DUF2188 domain-containing protein [Leptospira montravelensis]TGL02362.1 DUF2188 domain-containing protein [Leptospira montravelensis]
MSKKTHHVVPAQNGGWNIKKGGGERAILHTQTKKEAIDKGREISKNQHSEFYIHNLNGQISQKDSHGNDKYPPKG